MKPPGIQSSRGSVKIEIGVYSYWNDWAAEAHPGEFSRDFNKKNGVYMSLRYRLKLGARRPPFRRIPRPFWPTCPSSLFEHRGVSPHSACSFCTREYRDRKLRRVLRSSEKNKILADASERYCVVTAFFTISRMMQIRQEQPFRLITVKKKSHKWATSDKHRLCCGMLISKFRRDRKS